MAKQTRKLKIIFPSKLNEEYPELIDMITKNKQAIKRQKKINYMKKNNLWKRFNKNK